MKMDKVYLGDGVYAIYDGFHILLYTDEGYGPTNQIALEDSVFYALLDFAKKIEWMED
jgi:hypothetical protein